MINLLKRKSLSYYVLFRILLLGFLPGCRMVSVDVAPDKISSINIIDRNGMSETISSKDRLSNYQKTDFLSFQPYQKVLRVYGREKNGDIHSYITSYHPNGQVKQYLEVVNNRALGTYKEWHPNGQIKVESSIVGGIADIHSQAQESWLFDGVNRAWDEDGNLIAEIFYSKGELEGESTYYHTNGSVWKVIPYEKNKVHGKERIFLPNQKLLQITQYSQGIKEKSTRYWPNGQIAFEEEYKKGLLSEATYFDSNGEQLSLIVEGNGFKPLFGKHHCVELQEHRQGYQEGLVRQFDENGNVVKNYYLKNGLKHGEEISYTLIQGKPVQKLLLTWYEGTLQGPVKTWYESGVLESQREMSHNKRNGISTAWYKNGSLMFIEEYEDDKLVKAEYYKMSEHFPVSTVDKGKGIATLFNSEGHFSKKIQYHEGKPVD